MKKFTILLGVLFFFLSSKGQTTLAAGDIIFSSYNAIPAAGVAPDTFSFITMVPITSSTTIYITDRGYTNPGWIASGSSEGTISWVVGSSIAAGSQVQIAGLGAGAATIGGVSNGTVSVVSGGNATTGLSLGNIGDQLIAFQGGSGDPSAGGVTFISGLLWQYGTSLTTDATWNVCNGSNCTYGPQTSYIPPGLSTSNTMVTGDWVNAGTNYSSHGKFNCNGTPYSTFAALRTALVTKANWTLSNNTTVTQFDIPASCTFYSSCSNPTVTTHPSNTSVCASGNTSFTIAATGATSWQWQVNTGSGFSNITNGGVYSNATTSTLSITGATAGMSGYLYRCAAINGSCSSNSNQATLTVSNPSITVQSQSNVTCYGGNDGAITLNAPTGGISPYTYNWTPGNPTGDGTLSVTNLTAQTWTCVATDNISCTASQIVTITQPGLSLPSAAQTVTKSISGSTLYNNCNNAVATIAPNGASPVSGSVTAKVWIESVQPTKYVKRHYEITPAVNVSTATARVTLYFSQADFDGFNAVNALKLPLNAADVENYKNNLLIEKRSGTSSDGFGWPGTYSGSVTTIDPVNSDIVWNGSLSRWEVSFDVSGFSGFFAKTLATSLPLTWLNLSAERNAQKQVLIKFSVREQQVLKYEIERSNDGNLFRVIGSMASKGNGTNEYLYTDDLPRNGESFYRVKQIDQDGSVSRSRVIRISVIGNSLVALYPNPADQAIQLTITPDLLNKPVSVFTASGQKVRTFVPRETVSTVAVNDLVKGIYFLRFSNGRQQKLIKN